ncbi:hypothetical protein [Streptomyces sp. H51]|uniref:anti-sigma factor family protein n=1 Tax=Streptomyces sp. H51 TaxID=3111770 RepID=UPI002D76C781|nr:hypothetical protein [Streptomyces sp. H51]
MTSTQDSAGHPDIAEISDLAEGLLPPATTTDVRRHLDDCELCADVYASLEEIRGLLGSLPGPPRMPADVAGRIDAALAAEALLSATTSGTSGAQQPATGSGSPAGTDDGTHVSRETSSTNDRPTGRARPSTTGPGRKDHKRSGRRRAAVLGTVFAAAALGLGSVLLTTLDDTTSSGTQADGRQTTAADTFSRSKLEKHVSDLLAKERGSATGTSAPHSDGVQNGSGIASPKLLRTPAVPDCVQKGLGRTDPALATEEGTYKGGDALLVVLPDPSDSTKVTAYIVDSTCVTHPSSAKADVLLEQSYTRSSG